MSGQNVLGGFMSYKAIKNLKNHLEVEFIKSLSPDEINEIMYKLNTQITHFDNEYRKQKTRADLLQDDLNSVDILHFDECARLHAEIAELKVKLKQKGN